MQQLLNLKTICEQNIYSFSKNTDIALFGDINYSTKQEIMQALSSNSQFPFQEKNNESERSVNLANIPYLKHTKYEISAIDSTFKNNKCKSNIFQKEKANEESFKKLQNNSPKIIHVATHALYLIQEDSTKILSKNELLSKLKTLNNNENNLANSCLLFSGANTSIKNEQVNNIDDGILMAYEIANLDLSNTKLAVFSACQTGLGDIKGNEGVFGLQRAFKKAGVQYIIMSLWNINDKKSYRFMKEFYSNCFKEKNIQKAFYKTQQRMKEKYPNMPYYWAAFTLVQ